MPKTRPYKSEIRKRMAPRMAERQCQHCGKHFYGKGKRSCDKCILWTRYNRTQKLNGKPELTRHQWVREQWPTTKRIRSNAAKTKAGIKHCQTCGSLGPKLTRKRNKHHCLHCRRVIREREKGAPLRLPPTPEERAEAERIKQEHRQAALMRQWEQKPWTKPGLSCAEVWRIRYRHDEAFAIRERLRRQMRKAAKRDGVMDLMRGAIKRDGDSPAIQQRLGYTIQELREHLESQFTKGMTWDEFKSGAIHIDHIVPQSEFDLSKQSEWLECWSLSNLRPMWAAANIAKSNARVYLL